LKPLIHGLWVATVVLVLAFAVPVTAQQQPAPCSTPEYRQFDFWIGSWRVERASDGRLAGHNTITRKHGGCVLHESYRTPNGRYAGESLNIYDRTRGVWHQSWVDTGGLLLRLEGGLRDGAMVLQGPGVNREGEEIINRITWNLIEGNPDRVRQHWEVSSDDGASWSTAFDGIYIRLEDGG